MHISRSIFPPRPPVACAPPKMRGLVAAALGLVLTLSLAAVPSYAETVPPPPQSATVDVPPPSEDAAAPTGPRDDVAVEAQASPGAYMGHGAAATMATGGGQNASRSDTRSSARMLSASPSGVQGLDVSGWQADVLTRSKSQVDWQHQWNLGSRFMYAKATEGNNFADASRLSHLAGAKSMGMLHGAYHFALPSQSTAKSQADFFVNNGGAWTADGSTLPPLLDMENNPYTDPTKWNYQGNTCYNMSPAALVSWVRDFSNQVLSRTGRLPVIYTNYYWWKECMADSSEFVNQALHIAAYGAVSPWMPGGWEKYSFWQYSSTGPFAGDSNVWNGTLAELQTFAKTPSFGSFQPVSGAVVQRTSGADRFGTSAAISREHFASGVSVAYIANGQSFPDALSGASAAGTRHGPVLLANSAGLPSVIEDELKRLKPQQIVILGGTGALSPKVEADLSTYSSSVTRISGPDRYATSAALSRATYRPGVAVAYVASGLDFPDALSGAAAAGKDHAPILLATKDGLPDVIKEELRRLQPQKIVILGGDGVLAPNVTTTLTDYSSSVTVLAGADRYATSAAISASTFKLTGASAFIASGQSFPDSLSSAAAAGAAHVPLLLTYSEGLPSPVRAELNRLTPKRLVFSGGTGVISDSVLNAVR